MNIKGKRIRINILSLLMIWCFSQIAMSGELANSDPLLQKIEKIAKELRRQAWIQGHTEVESYVSKPSLAWLKKYTSQAAMKRYDSELDSKEISDLFRCFHVKDCELFYIALTSEYWGGFGEVGNFILYQPKTERYDLIDHVVYAE